MGESTKHARQAVIAARASLATEVSELTAATRSAIDIPAKVRAHPAETAGLAGGAAFLAVGGPKRVLRGLGRVARRGREPAPRTLLPRDVQKVVDGLGDDGKRIQARLEREFADYLEKRKKSSSEANSRASFWRLFDIMVIPVGRQAAKQMAGRLMAADPERPPTRGGPTSGDLASPTTPASGRPSEVARRLAGR